VPTVAEFLYRWLDETVAPNLAPLTYATYESHVKNYIEPGIGSLRLDRLRVADVQGWLNRLAARCQCCVQGKTPVATRQAAAADERPTHAPPGHSNSDQAATLVGAAAAALCIQLDGRGKMMRSPNGRCSRHDQSHSAAPNPGRTRFPGLR